MSGCASMSRRRGPAGWDARTSRSLTPRGHERAARARDDVRTRERVRARDPVVILSALRVCARSGATRAAMPLVARHPHTRGRSVETVSRRVRGSRALAVDVGGFTETTSRDPAHARRLESVRPQVGLADAPRPYPAYEPTSGRAGAPGGRNRGFDHPPGRGALAAVIICIHTRASARAGGRFRTPRVDASVSSVDAHVSSVLRASVLRGCLMRTLH